MSTWQVAELTTMAVSAERFIAQLGARVDGRSDMYETCLVADDDAASRGNTPAQMLSRTGQVLSRTGQVLSSIRTGEGGR